MAKTTINASNLRLICNKCKLDDCLTDLPRGKAGNLGCELAPMVSNMQWARGSFMDFYKDTHDNEICQRQYIEYHGLML